RLSLRFPVSVVLRSAPEPTEGSTRQRADTGAPSCTTCDRSNPGTNSRTSETSSRSSPSDAPRARRCRIDLRWRRRIKAGLPPCPQETFEFVLFHLLVTLAYCRVND